MNITARISNTTNTPALDCNSPTVNLSGACSRATVAAMTTDWRRDSKGLPVNNAPPMVPAPQQIVSQNPARHSRARKNAKGSSTHKNQVPCIHAAKAIPAVLRAIFVHDGVPPLYQASSRATKMPSVSKNGRPCMNRIIMPGMASANASTDASQASGQRNQGNGAHSRQRDMATTAKATNASSVMPALTCNCRNNQSQPGLWFIVYP